MADSDLPPEESEPKERLAHPFRTLRELIDHVSGRRLPTLTAAEVGLADPCPSPSWLSSASAK